ncbi:RNA polymerase sigma factor [Chitinophaga polysaccharea]|uniref:RNA polymerase sigma factor n=1 Tax=Chitinophaga polysaccharea TaxID=1293035 RepID=UPI001C8DB8C4|nr:sigma factor [Chitinophaga polysaccharea]
MNRYQEQTDVELIASLRGGDNHAFAEIYHRYWKKLLAIAYHHSKDKIIGEEIVQEVFIGLWNRRNELYIDHVSAYLATAVKLSVFKQYVRQKRRNEIKEQTADPLLTSWDEEKIYSRFLEAVTQGWSIVKPQPLQLGDWNKQGLPLYGNGVTYTKTFIAGTPAKSYAVELGKWKGTVAAVKVNDLFAGVITAEPNTLAIGEFVRKGTNKIEVTVIGSLKNVLGPFYNKPAPGLVDPGKWYNIKTQPPGNEYDLYEYGLTDDYEIKVAQ